MMEDGRELNVNNEVLLNVMVSIEYSPSRAVSKIMWEIAVDPEQGVDIWLPNSDLPKIFADWVPLNLNENVDSRTRPALLGVDATLEMEYSGGSQTATYELEYRIPYH